ncbi:hypothetical protein COEREDRAFT_87832 [Coemansia reversa NRRL 1564]|uniref:Uncharacterized protein n=1 Tax=Coemansia reversa (strain ATCC 12441 / NRRL 1564) TaxID=763665 RepID=A0A2G5B8S1_COERN|nr:hypothetical protein COEREDRAFT_87832 [Coemansia reversa NRRL 1564]|eukprot:PIA15416.1 hypothetical protein COEREDRAFT_87832 [Coemansia reversa NRRL 1564]
MDLEIERELMDAPTTPNPEAGENKFDRLLNDAMKNIEGLMLVVITDADRTVVFREAMTVFHEPRFEEALIDRCYDSFEDTKKLQIGVGNVLTLFFEAMQILQFRVGSYYGTIVCDIVCNMGLVHILVKRIRECLAVFVKMSKEPAGTGN